MKMNLLKHYGRGIINEEEYNFAYDEANKIIAEMKSGNFKLEKVCNIYFEELINNLK